MNGLERLGFQVEHRAYVREQKPPPRVGSGPEIKQVTFPMTGWRAVD
jgi:hypothetical protein